MGQWWGLNPSNDHYQVVTGVFLNTAIESAGADKASGLEVMFFWGVHLVQKRNTWMLLVIMRMFLRDVRWCLN